MSVHKRHNEFKSQHARNAAKAMKTQNKQQHTLNIERTSAYKMTATTTTTVVHEMKRKSTVKICKLISKSALQ